MRLKPVRRIPLNMLTFDRMRKAGLKGNIQGPRLVPEELRDLFDAALRVSERKDSAGTAYRGNAGSSSDDSGKNLAAWEAEKQIRHPESDPAEHQKTRESVSAPEGSASIESQVNKRVWEEFMRQIREKKAELADLDMKRENILKEISLLEDMLAKL